MAETVTELTAAVNAALSKLSPADEIPDPARFQLLDSLDKLRRIVEPPVQSLLNICWAVRYFLNRFGDIFIKEFFADPMSPRGCCRLIPWLQSALRLEWVFLMRLLLLAVLS